jgi:hypothetical protein
MTGPQSAPAWRRSTRCDSGACVEVANAGEHVFMRDSKNPAAPALAFSRHGWTMFLAGLKAGEFN